MPDLSSALHLAASEVTLAVGALVLLMVGAFIGDLPHMRQPRQRAVQCASKWNCHTFF